MSTMLLHDFAYVAVPAERVRDRILANHGEWLAPLAAAAASEGEALRLRVGPMEALPMLGKTVTVQAGEPITRGEVTVVPLVWRATGAPGLFPVLSADLEVAALDSKLTQLTLRGSYDPPWGRWGEGSIACSCTAWPRRAFGRFCAGSRRGWRRQIAAGWRWLSCDRSERARAAASAVLHELSVRA